MKCLPENTVAVKLRLEMLNEMTVRKEESWGWSDK
jgi:hypothetical protein